MNFDISIPKTDKERKARNAACLLSIVRGNIPFLRSVGIRADIDASAIGGAQRLMGYAAQDVETHVKGAKVTRGNVIVEADGKTTVRLVLQNDDGIETVIGSSEPAESAYKYAHDHEGYTQESTIPISYKSAKPADWGEAAQGGLMSGGSLFDFRSLKFFAAGIVGWMTPNELAAAGLYPDIETENYTVSRAGVSCAAVVVKDLSGEYYALVEADIPAGWMTEQGLIAGGWMPGTSQPVALKSAGIDSWGAPCAGSFAIAVGTGPFDRFYWLNDAERWGEPNDLAAAGGYPAEAEDLTLERNGITSDAVCLSDSDSNAHYLIRLDLDQGWMTESEIEARGWSHPSLGLIVLLGAGYNGSGWSGGDVQYMNSSIARIGVMTQSDATAIAEFGLTLTGRIDAYHSGPYGFIQLNSNYEFEILGVYSDESGATSVDVDLSWFAIDTSNNWVNLGGAGWGPPYAVSLKTCKLRISKKEPSMYDVWIETVDNSSYVVIALRTVFSGLTAARANTIVNNAPVPLSRYNSYLSDRGGPYSQADAIAMRDSLQSYIPAGDGSLFGIRPAES